MKHLEEGTIHAWLDGALSDAEAREVSEHAASCAQCGALVAEARGFIAGASRILTSLDDAPAGVTFASLSAGAPKRAKVVAGAQPKRFWQAAPWVTGIAAALMLAIGIKEWRDRPSAKTAFAPGNATMDSLRMDVVRMSEPRALLDSAVRRQAQRELRPIGVPAAATPAAQPAPRLKLRAPAANASGAGAAGASAAIGQERAAVAVAAAAAADSTSARAESQKKDLAADAISPSTKLIPAVPAPTAAQPLGESLITRARRDERLLAGCYRFPEQLAFERAEVTSAKAPTREAPPTAAAGAERRLAAPAAQGAAAFTVPAVPAIVRLDTTMTSIGRVIRSPETGEAIGTWRAVEGDSIRVSVQMGRSRIIPASYRVTCPDTARVRP